ncbi:hypothetical protein GLYMA_11G241151v4 [Glycine max]|nr:hypothetical protein GLYMA_11G241151v4 [Glycine max]KAH1160590.1 hypothetical protein GYH30_032072 [Glycine max]
MIVLVFCSTIFCLPITNSSVPDWKSQEKSRKQNTIILLVFYDPRHSFGDCKS